MRTGLTLSIIAILLSTCVIAQEASLADQAAAAQNRRVVRLDPESAGRVVKGDYHNEHVGLIIRKLPNWEAMSRGEMNVTEGAARTAAGMKGAIQSQSRVYGMKDLRGSTLIASIIPVPPGADTHDLQAKLQAAIASQLPDPSFSDEPVALSDANHKFVAFRVSYELMGKQLYQSQQAVVQGDHLVALTLTAPTPDELGNLWESLKPNVTWTK